MTIPDSSTDPAGASTPEPDLDGTQQLTDAGALEGEEDALPTESEAPYEGSGGRS